MTEQLDQAARSEPAELDISKGWVQGIALVMIFGFFVMGLLALRTYTDSMPLPEKVVAESGETVYTQADITAGQQTFLRRGLQQYGSVMGHGGYLGPDGADDASHHPGGDPQGNLVDGRLVAVAFQP